jgi:hypothetical protein
VQRACIIAMRGTIGSALCSPTNLVRDQWLATKLCVAAKCRDMPKSDIAGADMKETAN